MGLKLGTLVGTLELGRQSWHQKAGDLDICVYAKIIGKMHFVINYF